MFINHEQITILFRCNRRSFNFRVVHLFMLFKEVNIKGGDQNNLQSAVVCIIQKRGNYNCTVGVSLHTFDGTVNDIKFTKIFYRFNHNICQKNAYFIPYP